MALDGKDVRGVRRASTETLLLLSAFTQESGLSLTLRSFPESEEQAAVRSLLAGLPLQDRVVTLDALDTQRDTSQLIPDRGGDYVLTAKGNQPSLCDASKIGWHLGTPPTRTVPASGHAAARRFASSSANAQIFNFRSKAFIVSPGRFSSRSSECKVVELYEPSRFY